MNTQALTAIVSCISPIICFQKYDWIPEGHFVVLIGLRLTILSIYIFFNEHFSNSLGKDTFPGFIFLFK